jgi:AcrR family transcriptional regulator
VVATGARLSREARREQLVTLGAQLVATSSFDAVSVDDVAARAGISRGLLFHYFPTKRDFQVAVAERAAEQLLAETEPDRARPPLDQLRAGVEAFVDHVAGRPDAYVSLVRGTGSGDPGLRAVNDRTRVALVARVLDRLGVVADDVPATVRLVVRAWVAASEEMVVAWLAEDVGVDRDTVVDLLVDGLMLQLASLLRADQVAALTADG